MAEFVGDAGGLLGAPIVDRDLDDLRVAHLFDFDVLAKVALLPLRAQQRGIERFLVVTDQHPRSHVVDLLQATHQARHWRLVAGLRGDLCAAIQPQRINDPAHHLRALDHFDLRLDFIRHAPVARGVLEAAGNRGTSRIVLQRRAGGVNGFRLAKLNRANHDSD